MAEAELGRGRTAASLAVLFSELWLVGIPPRHVLERQSQARQARAAEKGDAFGAPHMVCYQ